jgi:threonine/homoserine/homoserine lactone efflux protein
MPPGMLNMSAARISLKEGHNRSFMFSIGVCIVVGLQTYVATCILLADTKYLKDGIGIQIILDYFLLDTTKVLKNL